MREELRDVAMRSPPVATRLSARQADDDDDVDVFALPQGCDDCNRFASSRDAEIFEMLPQPGEISALNSPSFGNTLSAPKFPPAMEGQIILSAAEDSCRHTLSQPVAIPVNQCARRAAARDLESDEELDDWMPSCPTGHETFTALLRRRSLKSCEATSPGS